MPLLRSIVSPLLRTSLPANTVRPFVRMSSSVPVPNDFVSIKAPRLVAAPHLAPDSIVRTR